jgi:hypothetical protein
MKKLNGSEIDVIVNEIIKNVKEVKLSKIKEVLEVNSNYKEIVSLYDKKYELKKELEKLDKEINNVNNVINEEFKVKIYNENNNVSWEYLNKLYVSFDYKDVEKYSYSKVRSKVILSSISKEFNVEEFIKKFVDEYIN